MSNVHVHTLSMNRRQLVIMMLLMEVGAEVYGHEVAGVPMTNLVIENVDMLENGDLRAEEYELIHKALARMLNESCACGSA